MTTDLRSIAAHTLLLGLAAATSLDAKAITFEDFCSASVEAINRFGSASYTCMTRPQAKVARFESNDPEATAPPSHGTQGAHAIRLTQEGLFWAGAIGFSMAASKPGSEATDWIYEGRISSLPGACASLSETNAKALALHFGRDPARMSTPAFAAQAWPLFTQAPCGSARALPRAPQGALPAKLCPSVLSSAKAQGSLDAFACEDTVQGPMLTQRAGDPSLTRTFAFIAAASELSKANPGASALVQPYANFEPSICVKAPLSDLAPLAPIFASPKTVGKTQYGMVEKLFESVANATSGHGPYASACPGYAKPSPIDIKVGFHGKLAF